LPRRTYELAMSADPLEGARGRWGHWSLMLNGLRALPLPYVVAMTVGDASEVATVSGAGATVLVLPAPVADAGAAAAPLSTAAEDNHHADECPAPAASAKACMRLPVWGVCFVALGGFGFAVTVCPGAVTTDPMTS
jgi:hypothetical protein